MFCRAHFGLDMATEWVGVKTHSFDMLSTMSSIYPSPSDVELFSGGK